MRLSTMALGGAILLCVTGCPTGPDSSSVEGAVPVNRPVIPDKASIPARAFSVGQVRLLGGPFRSAMERDKEYLLLLNPDRLLAGFRTVAGLDPKGERYGSWEGDTIAGHSLGHHLSAVSLMYASTGDEGMLDRANYIVGELAECQDASGDGYLAAFDGGREALAQVAQGDIRSRRFNLNGIWVPWYTTHKVLAGLRDAYLFTGSDQALEVAGKMADWMAETLKGLSREQFQQMLETEHGGMNEVLADLYALTGHERHLELARRFNHEAVLHPLSVGVDDLKGLHGNTQIPKVIGAARQYELTGEEPYRRTAQFFWDTVIRFHTFANGGHGEHEHFGLPGQLSPLLSNQTAETCNTHNMLKLTKHLFSWSPREEYATYYERALFNHILASQHPQTGMFCYFMPLQQGAQKRYSTPEDSFWCCVGTGMENHARYGESIYWHDDDGIYVNLFIASRVTWPEKSMALRQETSFPESENTQIVFENTDPVEIALRIRRPSWAGEEFSVAVNGVVDALPQQDGYVIVNRTWENGDVVDVSLPMDLWSEPLPDDPNKVALFYGPVLLAGVLGESGDTAPAGWNGAGPPEEPTGAPYFEPAGADVKDWVQPVAGQPLRFKTQGIGRPNDIELVPLYHVVHETYSVYWDLMTSELLALRDREAEEERQKLADLDRRTLDTIVLGNEESEKPRNLRGERHGARLVRGKTARSADGWFSFDLAGSPSAPIDLVCRYWGGDGRYPSFDILVNGATIASQELNYESPGRFVDINYRVPLELTRGQEKASVRLESHSGRSVGPVYECRTVRR